MPRPRPKKRSSPRHERLDKLTQLRDEWRARAADRVASARRAVERNRAAKAARKRAAVYVADMPRELCSNRAPSLPMSPGVMGRTIQIATYNVHRWTGLNGRRTPDPARACFVISELDADVIALQEVLRPATGSDPLAAVADALGLHVAFAPTRLHRHGDLGNAILSRWPIQSVSVLDLSFSRIEKRVAVAARFQGEGPPLGVVATHLALVDRTRHRQVRELLEHPHLHSGPVVLMGDMNAWRRCPATRALEESLRAHGNLEWPASFPASRPVLALDRVYARGVKILEVAAHGAAAARRASDHLPVLARIEIPEAS
jgi:endonuclease/exonuclease/phosphatase family metal-dependent hydrolase